MNGDGGVAGPAPRPPSRGGFESSVERVTTGLALLGGAILVGVSAVVAAGVLGRWLLGQEITGAFEIVQIGVALAAFLFLPACQLHNRNIVVDTFTARLPERARHRLDALWAFGYAALALALSWRLALGAAETVGSRTVSAMLQLPFGWAMAAGAGALAFLAVVSALVAVRHLRGEAG